jgi:type VI protein secretion system component VasF
MSTTTAGPGAVMLATASTFGYVRELVRAVLGALAADDHGAVSPRGTSVVNAAATTAAVVLAVLVWVTVASVVVAWLVTKWTLVLLFWACIGLVVGLLLVAVGGRRG